MNTTQQANKRQEAIEYLRAVLKPGDTVYTVLRSVSRSGMFRRLDCYLIKDNRPVWITGRVAEVIACRYSDEDWRKSAGLGVPGCGMDMGWHVVYSLSQTLFSNPDGSYSHEGAYALKQEWL